jgi:D-alanyl-D-alanine carboxypeptidase
MTAARPENRHIVVIAFGFETSGARDAKVRELVKKYVGKGRNGGYLDVAMIPSPGRKGATVQVASAEPVTPMPYPAFRQDAINPQPEAMQVAAVDPDPVAVARQLADPLIVSAWERRPFPSTARPISDSSPRSRPPT